MNLNYLKSYFDSKQLDVVKEHKISVGQRVEIISRVLKNRTQYFRGIVISIYRKGLTSSFNVRKVTGQDAVEKKFLLFDKKILKITVLESGKVRQSKLYYMRNKLGAAFRLKTKKDTNRER